MKAFLLLTLLCLLPAAEPFSTTAPAAAIKSQRSSGIHGSLNIIPRKNPSPRLALLMLPRERRLHSIKLRVASGETPEEVVTNDDGNGTNNAIKDNVDIPPAVFQVVAAVVTLGAAYLGLTAAMSSASDLASSAGQALGTEIWNELGKLLGFMGSLLVALFEILRVVVPAVAHSVFEFGKAAAPVVAEKSQRLSDAAAPYVAEASRQVSEAAAPYVQEATSAVDSNLVTPLREAVDSNLVTPLREAVDSNLVVPLQSAQDMARASVEATLQELTGAVTAQVGAARDGLTSQVETAVKGVQDVERASQVLPQD